MFTMYLNLDRKLVTLQLSVAKFPEVPVGTDENSPAIHRRVSKGTNDSSAVGTAQKGHLLHPRIMVTVPIIRHGLVVNSGKSCRSNSDE